MSEKMYPLSIRELLGRMTEEYKTSGCVFGVTAAFRTAEHYAKLQKMYEHNAEMMAKMGRSVPPFTLLEDKFLHIFLSPGFGQPQNIVKGVIEKMRIDLRLQKLLLHVAVIDLFFLDVSDQYRDLLGHPVETVTDDRKLIA